MGIETGFDQTSEHNQQPVSNETQLPNVSAGCKLTRERRNENDPPPAKDTCRFHHESEVSKLGHAGRRESEKAVRIQGRRALNPSDRPELGNLPKHGSQVFEGARSAQASPSTEETVEAGCLQEVYHAAVGGGSDELQGSPAGAPSPGVYGRLYDPQGFRPAIAASSPAQSDRTV